MSIGNLCGCEPALRTTSPGRRATAGASAPPPSHLDTFPYCKCKRSVRLSRFGVEPEVVHHGDKFCFRLRAAATCAKPEDSCCQEGTSVTKFKINISKQEEP